MRSISSFARATVAFGLFPLPCFLSSRRLDLRSSLETLNSSSLRTDVYLCTVIIQVALDTARESGHCIRFAFCVVLLLRCNVEIA